MLEGIAHGIEREIVADLSRGAAEGAARSR
jgi:hypothetical protein